MKNSTELLFIYNANSGIANALVDYGKKLVAPSKYDCQLCLVTYGPFGEKKRWKEFVNSINRPVRFLHVDEFKKEFSKKHPKFPCLVENDSGNLNVLLNDQDFKEINELESLIKKVESVI